MLTIRVHSAVVTCQSALGSLLWMFASTLSQSLGLWQPASASPFVDGCATSSGLSLFTFARPSSEGLGLPPSLGKVALGNEKPLVCLTAVSGAWRVACGGGIGVIVWTGWGGRSGVGSGWRSSRTKTWPSQY
ncbi:hypothetical protein F5Y12DRAFT_757238 [Xylaria sp. FL1777]|nr:hypothetical protein F5Y12DRAFT_757238 [Xylaria sp. FL1777]